MGMHIHSVVIDYLARATSIPVARKCKRVVLGHLTKVGSSEDAVVRGLHLSDGFPSADATAVGLLLHEIATFCPVTSPIPHPHTWVCQAGVTFRLCMYQLCLICSVRCWNKASDAQFIFFGRCHIHMLLKSTVHVRLQSAVLDTLDWLWWWGFHGWGHSSAASGAETPWKKWGG
jgi:hypothetical protein